MRRQFIVNRFSFSSALPRVLLVLVYVFAECDPLSNTSFSVSQDVHVRMRALSYPPVRLTSVLSENNGPVMVDAFPSQYKVLLAILFRWFEYVDLSTNIGLGRPKRCRCYGHVSLKATIVVVHSEKIKHELP